MKKIILAKYGEMVLKGQNKRMFEDKLMSNIRGSLKNIGGEYSLSWQQSTIYIEPLSEDFDIDEAFEKVKKIFGISVVCIAAVVEKLGLGVGGNNPQSANADSSFPKEPYGDVAEEIGAVAVKCLREMLRLPRTFKVETRREDKHFPLNSPQLSSKIGGYILREIPELTVDVHNPEVTVNIEVRKDIYIYADKQAGAGGLPVGTNGKATLLLSGGIDSPVAGYMVAKRGVVVNAVHFYSYPYTSERAKDKVISLAKIMTDYCGRVNLYVVPFTDIQLAINKLCPPELLTLIMRRIMMRIAEQIAKNTGSQALITGESIGQVASQTMEALGVTDNAVNIPVFRPVIGMDKEEIVQVAKKIDTYETSILPYEDCCTVFVPKHPKTKPRLEQLVEAEVALTDIEEMMAAAIEATEIVRL